MKLRFHDLDYVRPPGCMVQILAHPHYRHRSIELSIFNEHRYAFFFWNKWIQLYAFKEDLITSPPALVTLDWHQDLAWPTKTEKGWLRRLDLENNKDVAQYAWANLGTLNDRHVMAAAYLNLIGDIYVHCRQGVSHRWADQHFKDRYGNIHTVRNLKHMML